MLVGLHIMEPVKKPHGLDISTAFAGHSQNVGRFPLPGTALPKARQWCRALQRQIQATWWSAVETDTHPAPGGTIHDETEAVMVEAALAVAAVQVLYEIFLGAYPRKVNGDMTSSDFEVYSHTHDHGRAVSGLKLIRNGEMHADVIVAPTVGRMVGVPFDDGTQGFRIFPHWAEYAALPEEVREARYPPKKPGGVGKLKTNQVHHDHFELVVGGELVVETLLDALAFFAASDPRIVRIDETGGPLHFPLPAICERDYERRHPDWSSRASMENELRMLCVSNPPDGERRTCIAHLQGVDGEVIAHCGYTKISESQTHIFTETPEQVKRDVAEFGYPYWMEDEGISYPVVLDDSGELIADSSRGEQSSLQSDEELPWLDWLQMANRDAFQYKDQRRPPR